MATLFVHYKPTFIRQLNKLDSGLQNEVIEKIELFKNTRNHQQLAVHKLHGRLAGRFAFSVNFKYRILFKHLEKTEVVLLVVGDHDIYN